MGPFWESTFELLLGFCAFGLNTDPSKGVVREDLV